MAASSRALFATKPLGREEVRVLVLERTVAARNKLVVANMRLVAIHARRYAARYRLDVEDLIQHGVLGLIRAIEKFDVDRGVAFSTYASLWIRQAIARIADEKTVTISHNVRSDVARVGRATRTLTSRLGREPSHDEIMTATKLDAERFDNIRSARTAAHALSFSTPLDAEHEIEFGDTIPDPESIDHDVASIVDERRRKERLYKMLLRLPERHRDLLALRFGLDGGPPQTLEQIADHYSLSRERVRQLEQIAFERLRTALGVRFERKREEAAAEEAVTTESPVPKVADSAVLLSAMVGVLAMPIECASA